jgi:2-polyprenyl-3-methyl-5-hydroxy-6-metoxy-1,4-benzoquinol methylase
MQKIKLIPIVAVVMITVSSCGQTHQKNNEKNMKDSTGHHQHHNHGGANEHMNKTSFEDLVKNFEDPERIKTQKPDEAISLLGDINGKTIMDIGAGTGYFAFRMVNKGAKVIAADVDKRFQDFIVNKRDSLKIPTSNLETRLVPYDNCNLTKEEADIVIIVDTYHHIEDRIAYFKKVKQGIKPNGRLLVLEYKKMEMPIPSPPIEMKLTPDTIKEELQKAGFSTFTLNDTLMPYQYVLIAQ